MMYALIRSLKKNASSRSTSTSGTFFFLRICHSNISASVLFFFNPENIIMFTHKRMCLLGVSHIKEQYAHDN